MGNLRSAIEELASDDVERSTDVRLVEDLEELEGATRAIEAERARRIGELDRRGVHVRDAFVSLTSWLTSRLRIAPSVAARHIRLARALPRMPHAAAALAAGELSVESAGLLVSVRDADPEQFDRCEEALVDLAARLPVADLRRAIERWRCLADTASAEAESERRFERRGLYVSPTLDGMVRLDGDLDPETGQSVLTAIRSLVDAWARSGAEDRRSPAQRRADALGELCRRYLDSADRPTVGGERPHLNLTVDLPVLERRAGRRCELDDAGGITAEAARRLACDAGLSRVIVGASSEPLDVGRRTPVVPPGLRRALVVRDRGCRFPGCDRPHPWTDAHHIVHWADGGPTSASNLVLLCRRHHRAVHGGFIVRVVDGAVRFERRDGTPLEARAP
jgi:hypothetical protein